MMKILTVKEWLFQKQKLMFPLAGVAALALGTLDLTPELEVETKSAPTPKGLLFYLDYKFKGEK